MKPSVISEVADVSRSAFFTNKGPNVVYVVVHAFYLVSNSGHFSTQTDKLIYCSMKYELEALCCNKFGLTIQSGGSLLTSSCFTSWLMAIEALEM